MFSFFPTPVGLSEDLWRAFVTNFAATAFVVVVFAASRTSIPLKTCLACNTNIEGKAMVILGTVTALPTSIMGRVIGDVPIGIIVNDCTMCVGVKSR